MISPRIKSQVMNTTAGFALITIASGVIFLIANAIAVGLTATNIPTPIIRTIAVKGLEVGPARVYVDIEFPGTKKGNLISAQTDGPLKVAMFVSDYGAELSSVPALSVDIPNGVNLNLASKTASHLVIDDLQINFEPGFDTKFLSKLISAKIGKTLLKKEQLPIVQVKVETRIVFKSLWIPFGFSVNYPHIVDLDILLPPPKPETEEEKKAEEKRKAEEEKKAEEEEKKKKKSKMPPKQLTELEKKQEEAMKTFDFKPRSVKILASDSEKLEITTVAALPAIMVPEFLTVEVPTISLRANFFKVGETPEKNGPISSMLTVRIDPFLLQPTPLTDSSKEIQVRVSLLIDQRDVRGLTSILELARDEKFEEIGLQITLGNGKKLEGGLMHWLRDLVVDIQLKDLLKKDEEEEKKKQAEKKRQSEKNGQFEKKDETKELEQPEQEQPQLEHQPIVPESTVKNQIVSFKFLKTEKLTNGGAFIFQVKILRSFASFFIGKLPELVFEAEIENQEATATELIDVRTQVFGVKVSSTEVTEESEAIEIDFQIDIENLKDLIYTGISLGKLGSKEYHELVPEIRRIKSLKINSKSDNIISRLAAIFNVEVLINDKDGLLAVKFQNSERIIFPKPEKVTEPPENENEKEEKIVIVKKVAKQMELATKFSISNGVDLAGSSRNVNIAALIEMVEIPYFGDFVQASWENFTLNVKTSRSRTILQFQISQGAMELGITGGAKPIFVNFSTGITIPAEDKDLEELSALLKVFLEAEKEIMNLSFEIYSGPDEANAFVLDASIPCKKLLTATLEPENPPVLTVDTASAGTKDSVSTEPKDSVSTERNVAGSTEAATSASTTGSAGSVSAVTLETKKPAAPSPKAKREDFIGKIQNSILSFVSFQASTWLFHVTYPDGHYCQANESFDLKLKVEVSLPMIEANLCSKARINDELNCFLSAGISRPMTFSIDLVDGNICHVESVVLPQERYAPLAGLTTIKQSTNVKYENNEIPIHISIRDFTQLVVFGEWAATKKRQFITVGPVKEGSGFNNLLGVVISSVFSKEIPEPKPSDSGIATPSDSEAAKPKPATSEETQAASSGETQAAQSIVKKIISFNPNEPAILQIQGYSANENDLEILIGFNLP